MGKFIESLSGQNLEANIKKLKANIKAVNPVTEDGKKGVLEKYPGLHGVFLATTERMGGKGNFPKVDYTKKYFGLEVKGKRTVYNKSVVDSSDPDVPEVSNELRLVDPIPHGKETGWEVKVGGDPLKPEFVAFVQTKMGTVVEYGLREEGYDGLVIEEVGGGGSVNVPYVIKDGQIYIGVIKEKRLLIDASGQPVENLSRGFGEIGVTPIEQAGVELEEELFNDVAEIKSDSVKKLSDRAVQLGGPVNMNSAYFKTTGETDGVKFFGIEVAEGEVISESEGSDPENATYKFNPNLISGTDTKGKTVTANMKFVHWRKTSELKDGFTPVGVIRLLAELGPEVTLFDAKSHDDSTKKN